MHKPHEYMTPCNLDPDVGINFVRLEHCLLYLKKSLPAHNHSKLLTTTTTTVMNFQNSKHGPMHRMQREGHIESKYLWEWGYHHHSAVQQA